MTWLYFLLGGLAAPFLVLLLVIIAATSCAVRLDSLLRVVSILRVILWFSTMILFIAAWINFQLSTVYGVATLAFSLGLILPQTWLTARIRKSQPDAAPEPD